MREHARQSISQQNNTTYFSIEKAICLSINLQNIFFISFIILYTCHQVLYYKLYIRIYIISYIIVNIACTIHKNQHKKYSTIYININQFENTKYIIIC